MAPGPGGDEWLSTLMETAITTQKTPVRRSNFFQHILPPTGLVLGLVLTTVWMCFLGYGVVRLFQAVL